MPLIWWFVIAVGQQRLLPHVSLSCPVLLTVGRLPAGDGAWSNLQLDHNHGCVDECQAAVGSAQLLHRGPGLLRLQAVRLCVASDTLVHARESLAPRRQYVVPMQAGEGRTGLSHLHVELLHWGNCV